MSDSNGNTPQNPGTSQDPGAVAQEVEELERRSQTAARLFDVRRIIGGLFVVYGVIITVAGIFATEADIKKAENVNINLWTGLAMLVLGLAFLVWLRVSPTIPPPAATEEAEEGTPSS
ncbi:hypothetical protein [Streptomyces sp. ODS28]|uniref:hypothetical protein n=1 Tax=Streptomyces sp. ODS28 TaxID=3136688 RepID=UPI0031E51590